MSFGVMLAVLAAAFLNAAWNTSVKLLPDKFIAISLIMFGAGAVSLPFALLALAVAPAAYPFLALSALLQVIYCVLINRAYHTADLSLAYPLMRGAAPVLTTLAAVFLREKFGLPAPSPPHWWSAGWRCCAWREVFGNGQQDRLIWAS